MRRISVRITAKEIATRNDVVAHQSLEIENEGQAAAAISRALFMVGQTGIVQFNSETKAFRLFQPSELTEITATHSLIVEPTLNDIKQVVTK